MFGTLNISCVPNLPTQPFWSSGLLIPAGRSRESLPRQNGTISPGDQLKTLCPEDRGGNCNNRTVGRPVREGYRDTT